MKNIKKSTTTQSIPTPQKKSLFDSIVDNEALGMNEYDCQRHANRVGLLFKVLYNRDLWQLRTDFENELTALIRRFASSIDDELSKTKEDC